MKEKQEITVVLADDHQLFREGVCSLLRGVEGVRVIGAVASGEELLELLEKEPAHIAMVDMAMGGMNGIETTMHITKRFPQTSVLILSMHNTEEFIQGAIQAGARGYLPKDTDRDILVKALREIREGHLYLDPNISEVLVQRMVRNTTSPNPAQSKKELLTPRELEIIKKVAEGYINKEIADQLNISVRTVDAHKNNIMNKLELKTTVDMVRFAIKNGIIKL